MLVGREREKAIWAHLALRKLSSALAACRICLPSIPRKSAVFLLPGGEKILCPWDDAFIIDEVWNCQVYEKFFEIERGSVVVDVGAHVGIFAVKASKKVGSRGLVIACEPHPTTYALLEANLKNNRCDNVLPLNVALSDFRGESRLYLHPTSCQNSLARRTARSIRVPVDTLDGVVTKLGLKRVDFIKIDVEGSELEVLRGAEGLLQDDRLGLSIAGYHTPTEAQNISQFLISKARKVLVADSFVYVAQ